MRNAVFCMVFSRFVFVSDMMGDHTMPRRDSSMNQAKGILSRSEMRKEKKVKPLFIGILGWVIWLASPFIQAYRVISGLPAFLAVAKRYFVIIT